MLDVIEEGRKIMAVDEETSNHHKNVNNCTDNDDDHNYLLSGVIFGKSIRSSFASLIVAKITQHKKNNELLSITDNGIDNNCDEDDDDDDDNDDEENICMVRIQFLCQPEENTYLRSYIRRFCKVGDSIRIQTGQWEPLVLNYDDSEWKSPRLVVHVHTTSEIAKFVQIIQIQYWSMKQCQIYQQKYLPTTCTNHNKRIDMIKSETDSNSIFEVDCRPKQKNINTNSTTNNNHHNCGLAKRTQGILLTNFIMHMMAKKLQLLQANETDDNSDNITTWSKTNMWKEQPEIAIKVVQAMSQKTVYDVAGGNGHVAMALSLAGIPATVIDPRENVGKLPKRDRKIYKQALKQKQNVKNCSDIVVDTIEHHTTTTTISNDGNGHCNDNNMMYCQPTGSQIVPFQSKRAWFGKPPNNVDVSFRHPDQESVPVIDNGSLLNDCSVIVALHPDEATDNIVDIAIKYHIPFVIVPCCVFSRLFIHRTKPNNNEPVTTYNDLIEYLMAKHKSIQKTTLPFEGANTILWSHF